MRIRGHAALPIGQSEDDQQRMLHQFTMIARKFNMIILQEKTKSLVVANEPTRCMFEIEGNTIQQVIGIAYLGITLGK